jgi:osmoprotectant transport system substrate-binding protein
MRRRDALGLIGSALVLSGCGAKTSDAIRIGSTSSADNVLIAQIYAIALERAHMPVERHMRLGDSRNVIDLLERAEIDVFPGSVLPHERHSGIVSLAASTAIESPCIVTSQYAAEKFWLLTLTTCAAIAPQLRLAASAGFVAPDGSLERLRRRYGGFRFKQVIICNEGAQTDSIGRGDADVANAFTTDGNIPEKQLVVVADDKHYWPRRHIVPLIRTQALQSRPRARSILNRISRAVSVYALQQMNMQRQLLQLDSYDVAEEFVRTIAQSDHRKRS